MDIVIAILFTLSSFLLVFAVLLTLPGTWLMVLMAMLLNLTMDSHPFSWWTIGIAIALAGLGELLELVAGGAGAKAMGASKRSVVASVLGGIVGAILGTILLPVPIIGTILGSALGAGAGAVVFEFTIADRRDLKHLRGIGTGAFTGRLLATVLKTAVALVMAVMLSVAAFV